MNDMALDAAVDPGALATLPTLDRGALTELWVTAFGCPAPRHAQAPLLRGALAWHAQMRRLRESAGAREVDRMARGLRRAASSASSDALAPGTRLLREWQGQTHHVTVAAHGFEYSGRTYRSLTAVARQITGTAWSGPLFFGLRS